MGLVLMWNIFEFDMRLFIQIIGTALGTRAAPTLIKIHSMDCTLESYEQ